MPLFNQTPFSPPTVDPVASPVDGLATVQREIGLLATNYVAGIRELPRHIDPLNYHDYTPKHGPLDNLQAAPLFLPSKTL